MTSRTTDLPVGPARLKAPPWGHRGTGTCIMAGPSDRPAPGRGLSARILLLAIAFLLLGEVLIYVPSIARFRLTYLQEHLAAARLASLSLEVPHEGSLPADLEAQLLSHAGVRSITLWAPRAERMLGKMMPVDRVYDLRNPNAGAPRPRQPRDAGGAASAGDPCHRPLTDGQGHDDRRHVGRGSPAGCHARLLPSNRRALPRALGHHGGPSLPQPEADDRDASAIDHRRSCELQAKARGSERRPQAVRKDGRDRHRRAGDRRHAARPAPSAGPEDASGGARRGGGQS